MTKLTSHYLSTLSLKQIKAIDIKSPEEEALINDALMGKSAFIKPTITFDHKKVPDIKNPEDEKKWQETIDKFNAKNSSFNKEVTQKEKELENINKQIAQVATVIINNKEVKDEPTAVPTSPVFKCEPCNKTFQKEMALKGHNTRYHKNADQTTTI